MKYVLNLRTKVYHIIGGCCHSKQYPKTDKELKEYKAEEDIIKEHQNYVCRCKICFRGK